MRLFVRVGCFSGFHLRKMQKSPGVPVIKTGTPGRMESLYGYRHYDLVFGRDFALFFCLAGTDFFSSCARYPLRRPSTEGRSLVVLVSLLSLDIEELVFVPDEPRSDRESFFGVSARRGATGPSWRPFGACSLWEACRSARPLSVAEAACFSVSGACRTGS